MSIQRDGITNLPLRDRCVANNQYAVKVDDLQWVRIPSGQLVARPEVTRAAKDSLKVSSSHTFVASPIKRPRSDTTALRLIQTMFRVVNPGSATVVG